MIALIAFAVFCAVCLTIIALGLLGAVNEGTRAYGAARVIVGGGKNEAK